MLWERKVLAMMGNVYTILGGMIYDTTILHDFRK
jgi:hypothetical protein